MEARDRTDFSGPIRSFPREVERAAARIGDVALRTPLEISPALSAEMRADVAFKWECAQITGSFKFRGALNKIRLLTAAEKRRGVVSASTGNHGLAVNHAARLENVALTLFLPESASPEKIARLRAAGADLRFFGTDCERTEAHARAEARKSGRTYISPYNDIDVIRGAGTVAIEILSGCRTLDAVVVPVGGGGLIAGIGGYVKSAAPSVRIIGVEPAASAFMKAAFAAGRIVGFHERATVADAVAGGIEAGSITYPLCRRFVDEIVTVLENDIRHALREIRDLTGRSVEGAGALPLAALRKCAGRFRGLNVVLVVSGKNIAPETFLRIVGDAGSGARPPRR